MNTYACTPANIDACSLYISKFLESKKFNSTINVKTRLFVETALLHWVEQTNRHTSFSVETYTFLGRQHIVLSLKGPKLQELPQSPQDEFLKMILTHTEAVFSEEYSQGTNIIDIKLPRANLGNNVKVFLSVAIALVLGNLINTCLPADIVKEIANDYVSPMFNSIIGILNAFVSFMIFFSIVASILGMGNIAVLKNVGLKYFKQVFVNTFLWTLLCLPICVFCFGVISNEGDASGSVLNKIYALLLAVIPNNIITPFLKGDSLQIVFLAIFSGATLLILDKEADSLKHNILQTNRFFQYCVGVICKTIPFFIFLSFLKIILTNAMSGILDSWIMMATIFSCYTLIMFGDIVYTCFRCKLPLVEYLKQVFPVFAVSLPTSNGIACLPQCEAALNHYKAEPNIISFGLPLGLVISKKTLPICYVGYILGLCLVFGKTLTMGQLIVLSLSSIILGFATPAVPGGSLGITIMLMKQYNLPSEAMGIAVSLSFLIGMVGIAVSSVCRVNDVMLLDRSLK